MEMEGAIVSSVKCEHNVGWAEKNPQLALNSVNRFLAKYAGDYDIDIDLSRDGYITYKAKIKR